MNTKIIDKSKSSTLSLNIIEDLKELEYPKEEISYADAFRVCLHAASYFYFKCDRQEQARDIFLKEFNKMINGEINR